MSGNDKIQKEKPRPAGWRVYDRHRKIVRTLSKKIGVSEGEIVRRSIEAYKE